MNYCPNCGHRLKQEPLTGPGISYNEVNGIRYPISGYERNLEMTWQTSLAHGYVTKDEEAQWKQNYRKMNPPKPVNPVPHKPFGEYGY